MHHCINASHGCVFFFFRLKTILACFIPALQYLMGLNLRIIGWLFRADGGGIPCFRRLLLSKCSMLWPEMPSAWENMVSF